MVASFQWMDNYPVILVTVSLPNIGLSFASFPWICEIILSRKIFEASSRNVVRREIWRLLIQFISVLLTKTFKKKRISLPRMLSIMYSLQEMEDCRSNSNRTSKIGLHIMVLMAWEMLEEKQNLALNNVIAIRQKEHKKASRLKIREQVFLPCFLMTVMSLSFKRLGRGN